MLRTVLASLVVKRFSIDRGAFFHGRTWSVLNIFLNGAFLSEKKLSEEVKAVDLLTSLSGS